MNAFVRMFRSVRGIASSDSAFETYYGQIIRSQSSGAPSASEARRDFQAARATLERISTL